MDLDALDDLGIITAHTGTPLLWERHGPSILYTSVSQPLELPQWRFTLPGPPPPERPAAPKPTLLVYKDGQWQPITGISSIQLNPQPGPEPQRPRPYWRAELDLNQVRTQIHTFFDNPHGKDQP